MSSESRSGRLRLLSAANDLFGGQPFAEVAVAELLASAGVRAPTLYHHFSDKEGLFVAWAESAFREIGTEVSGTPSAAVGTLEGLSLFTKALAKPDQIDILRVLRDADRLKRPESKDRVYAAYFQSLYEPLCELLLRSIERGEVRADSIGHMAATFMLGSLSVSPRWGVPGSAPSDDPTWWPRSFLSGFGAK